MVSKHQPILGSGFNQVSTSHQEMMKTIDELKELIMNMQPISNSSSDQHRPPPAPPHPQLHPFYINQVSPPSFIPQLHTMGGTAPQVFDEYPVRSYVTTHAPAIYTSPYNLAVQTTLSTGQPFYVIESTTTEVCYENASLLGELSPVTWFNTGCEVGVNEVKINMELDGEEDSHIDDHMSFDAIVCEIVAESGMRNELGVEKLDKSVYEDAGDTCEIDNETETKAEVSCVDEAKNEVETNAKKLLPPLLHLAFQAFDKFISKLGRFPIASTDKNAQKFITIVDILNESGGDAGKVVDINPEFLRQFPFGTRVVLNPLAVIFGGIVGQEVKACPMVATKLQKKLEDAQVFIVGSGASRDPSKKQAPMCVVHTSPHNIDHWLIWARSEFEGLLEKTPTEVDTILSDTSEYTSAIVSAGIFEWKDKDAMFSFVEATYKQQDRVRTLFDTGWNTLHQKHIHNDKFEGVITTYRQVGELFNPSAALKSVFSAAKIERLGNWFTDGSDPRWCCTYLLDATDSLFTDFGKAFIRQIFDPGGQAMEVTCRWRDVFWSVMFVTMLVLLKAVKLIKNEKWYHILEDKNVLKRRHM